MRSVIIWNHIGIGKFTPKATPVDSLNAGEVGYFVAGIKTLADINIGDTVTHPARPTDHPFPGYQPPQQMVFCDFYAGVGSTTGGGVKSGTGVIRTSGGVGIGVGRTCGTTGETGATAGALPRG